MDGLIHWAESRWPWVTPLLVLLAELARRWSSRRAEPRAPSRRWEDSEHILFPSRPGSGLARLLSSPARLALKEAGTQAMEEEIAGLRDDLKRVLADNKRLRAELDGLAGSNAGFTDMAGDKSPRLRRRRRPSSRSDG
jgi:hypothetical protein